MAGFPSPVEVVTILSSQIIQFHMAYPQFKGFHAHPGGCWGKAMALQSSDCRSKWWQLVLSRWHGLGGREDGSERWCPPSGATVPM